VEEWFMPDMQRFDLSGKVVLVTGGNTGIGLGLARGIARAGGNVAIAGRSDEKNALALSELRASGVRCEAFTFNLEDTAGLPAFYARVCAAMGGVDVLVNNAGIQRRGRADQIAVEDFERVMRVNVTAPYVLSQCFARERIARNSPGCIVFVASLMSEASRPTTSPYTASKGAIRQLVRALAVDWAPFGIRVNGIGPGYIETEMTRPLVQDPDFSAWVQKRTPLGRWGQPSDLAGAVVFLAADASAFITGQILYVDGGWLAAF
jgi:gluconate 5-dehydrogenase